MIREASSFTGWRADGSGGGAKNFERIAKGERRKISDLIFFISEIQCFLVFLWVLGYYIFWYTVTVRYKIFGQPAKGGQKILEASWKVGENVLKFNVFWCFNKFWGIFIFQVKGGRKISDESLGGAKNFRTLIFSESFGKIKGHVKIFFANMAFCESHKEFRSHRPPYIQ